jgi:hypothetical protein
VAKLAVKDAYDGVKRLIRGRFGAVNLDLIEKDPGSDTRRAVVAEDLRRARADKDEELMRRVSELVRLVAEQSPAAANAIGVDLASVTSASLKIVNVSSASTGVRASHIKTSGDIEISGIRAGQGGAGNQDPP